MRPCGANYETQCSSKWVAHGGGRRGTCEEGLGAKGLWEPWHTEQQHTALTVRSTAIHHRTCRQVADGPRIPACPALLLPPGIKPGFPPKHRNVHLICFIAGQQSKCQYSRASGWRVHSSTDFKYRATRSAVFYLYAGLEIWGRGSQYNMEFDWLIFSLWLQGSVKTVNLPGSPAGLRWL